MLQGIQHILLAFDGTKLHCGKGVQRVQEPHPDHKKIWRRCAGRPQIYTAYGVSNKLAFKGT